MTTSFGPADLPFPLIRRIAAWRKDFDDTATPPDRSDGAWWQRHEQEQINIAKALRAALEDRIEVVPLF
jgi:hypothetical protein